MNGIRWSDLRCQRPSVRSWHFKQPHCFASSQLGQQGWYQLYRPSARSCSTSRAQRVISFGMLFVLTFHFYLLSFSLFAVLCAGVAQSSDPTYSPAPLRRAPTSPASYIPPLTKHGQKPSTAAALHAFAGKPVASTSAVLIADTPMVPHSHQRSRPSDGGGSGGGGTATAAAHSYGASGTHSFSVGSPPSSSGTSNAQPPVIHSAKNPSLTAILHEMPPQRPAPSKPIVVAPASVGPVAVSSISARTSAGVNVGTSAPASRDAAVQAPGVTINFCPDCGAKRIENARFCADCGLKFTGLLEPASIGLAATAKSVSIAPANASVGSGGSAMFGSARPVSVGAAASAPMRSGPNFQCTYCRKIVLGVPVMVDRQPYCTLCNRHISRSLNQALNQVRLITPHSSITSWDAKHATQSSLFALVRRGRWMPRHLAWVRRCWRSSMCIILLHLNIDRQRGLTVRLFDSYYLISSECTHLLLRS